MSSPALLPFVVAERRFLGFGFLLTLVSSFGQTFFISLFNPQFRERFELTDGEFGLVYSLATLASGLVIIQAGRIVDAFDLRGVTAGVLLGLGVATGLIASAPSVLVLALGLFGLRLCGQGLCGHVSMTVMARTYGPRRGVAMSLAGAGHAAGEAILPVTAVLVLQQIGWRPTWAIIGGLLLLIVLPLSAWLLRTAPADRMRPPAPGAPATTDSAAATASPTGPPDWTRRQVLGDWRFFAILPVVLAPGTIVTGIFFHQVHLVEVREWALKAFAATFIIFSAAQVPSALIGGPLLDRIGATRLLPVAVLPMAAGLAVLAFVMHPVAAAVFMGLTGITAGLAGPVVGAAWAELYGVRHLGSIRSLAMSASVIGTASSPFAAGWMIDRGIGPSPMIATASGAAVLASGVAWATLRRRPAGTPPPAERVSPAE